MPVDAAESRSVADARAVASWLAERFGGPVELAEPPRSSGEGFDSVIHLVRFAGGCLPKEWRAPLVLRIKSDDSRAQEARDEAEIHGWLADAGYPAPRVLAVTAPGQVLDRPLQIMERAPGVLLIDHVRRAPWRTAAALRHMARLHVRLHGLPTEGFPADRDLLDRRLRMVRETAERLADDRLRAALDHVESIAAALRAAPGSVCHGDFHPLNVMADETASPDDGARLTVLDWTDAGIGDHHGDVARTLVLFSVASIVADNRAERTALRAVGPTLRRRYRRAYEELSPLDDRRLALWTPVHLLHGWAQACAIRAGLFVDDRAPRTTEQPTARLPSMMVEELCRRFDRAWTAL